MILVFLNDHLSREHLLLHSDTIVGQYEEIKRSRLFYINAHCGFIEPKEQNNRYGDSH